MRPIDTRIMPDGSPFVIPSGSVFILTGFEFTHNDSLQDGLSVVASPVIVNGFSFHHLSFASGAMKEANAFGSMEFSPGIPVASPAVICVDGGSNLSRTTMRIRGFFARNK